MKRKRGASAGKSGPLPPSADIDPLAEDTSGLTEYELERLKLIARNRARLLALGIPEAVRGLQALLPQPKQRPAKRVKHTPQPPAEPSRRSSRLQQQEAEQPEPGSELAVFIINGECPRCGRVITRGHRQHLEPCQGPPEPVQLSEEQLAEQAAAQVEQDKRKLQELELGGLVELGADEATFVVVGSTGNHYVVTFSDERRTCQCMDHRIRRRDCKHIKLVAGQLGISEDMARWRAGVEGMLAALPAASEQDKARVEQAQARRAARDAKAAGTVAAQAAEGAGAAAGQQQGSEQGAEQGKGKGGARRQGAAAAAAAPAAPANPAAAMAMKFM